MISEVVPIAKRDLKAGETVGEIGSADIYSTLYIYEEAKTKGSIPTGLAPGGKVLKDIAKGELLTEENVAPDTTKVVYKLRQMQDVMLGNE
jgi:predicted homoserine dehydrogenase-like protein